MDSPSWWWEEGAADGGVQQRDQQLCCGCAQLGAALLALLVMAQTSVHKGAVGSLVTWHCASIRCGRPG